MDGWKPVRVKDERKHQKNGVVHDDADLGQEEGKKPARGRYVGRAAAGAPEVPAPTHARGPVTKRRQAGFGRNTEKASPMSSDCASDMIRESAKQFSNGFVFVRKKSTWTFLNRKLEQFITGNSKYPSGTVQRSMAHFLLQN
uniref:Telomerase reverse transcriptase n=1 Tax=Angiostrongylus cantonensis TaxID=6313 RepID=A0A0K0DFD4_ANGCA